MAYDFLKKLFGDAKEGEDPKAMTYNELEAAIDADKSIKVADLATGAYVSKDKFDAKVTELDGTKQQLSDANTQIQSYKDMDIDGIKKAATDWETKYNTDTQALQDKIEAQERSHQKDMFFSGVQFSSNAAKVGIMAQFDEQGFQFKDGVFQGADAWLAQQKENDAASFVTEEKNQENEPSPKFTNPKGGSTGNGSGKKMTLAEAMKYKNEHPNVDVSTLL